MVYRQAKSHQRWWLHEILQRPQRKLLSRTIGSDDSVQVICECMYTLIQHTSLYSLGRRQPSWKAPNMTGNDMKVVTTGGNMLRGKFDGHSLCWVRDFLSIVQYLCSYHAVFYNSAFPPVNTLCLIELPSVSKCSLWTHRNTYRSQEWLCHKSGSRVQLHTVITQACLVARPQLTNNFISEISLSTSSMNWIIKSTNLCFNISSVWKFVIKNEMS